MSTCGGEAYPALRPPLYSDFGLNFPLGKNHIPFITSVSGKVYTTLRYLQLSILVIVAMVSDEPA